MTTPLAEHERELNNQMHPAYRQHRVPDEIVPEGRLAILVDRPPYAERGQISVRLFHGLPDSENGTYWWGWEFYENGKVVSTYHQNDVSMGINNITPLDLIAVYQAYEWFKNRSAE